MATRYVLYWFDVEDCTVTQSDDAAKRLAQILTKHGVRGTMKLVGQKARLLRERVRYDVIDALAQHAVGYHSNLHGLRPQIAEYLGPLDWEEGTAEFDRREAPGLDDLRDLWHIQTPVCYGQPGSNWAPQVFPALRRWGVRTYVSGFGFVGLHCQPFWYGGLLNTSHLYGTDRHDASASHYFGLNFELGTPGALAEHQKRFTTSYEALTAGGLISIMNHPCTLVLREWFSTDMKTPEQIQAGYEHFAAFVAFVNSHPDVRTVTADELPALYPDHAHQRVFSPQELLALAEAVGEEVYYLELPGMALAPVEVFAMFARFLRRAFADDPAPGAVYEYHDGPAAGAQAATEGTATRAEMTVAVSGVCDFLDAHGHLPAAVPVGVQTIALESFYVALAAVIREYATNGRLPETVRFGPAVNRIAEHVDAAAAKAACGGAMMLPGFSAPKLYEQACLQAWTLKPALLSGG